MESNDKYFLTLGAFLAFVLSLGISAYQGNPWSSVLRDACVSAFIGVIIMKIALLIFYSGLSTQKAQEDAGKEDQDKD